MSESPRSNVPSPVWGMAPAWEDPGSQFSPALPSNANQPSGNVASGNVDHDRKASVATHETAERIGSAVGNARRQLHRGLQLVRNPGGRVTGFSAAGSSERSVADASTADLQENAGRADELRRDTLRLFDYWRSVTAERLQQLRSRARAIADEYPLHTIAAIAGSCFFLGIALRLRRQNRG